MFNLQVHIAPFVQNKVFARRNYVPLLDRHTYAAVKHQDWDKLMEINVLFSIQNFGSFLLFADGTVISHFIPSELILLLLSAQLECLETYSRTYILTVPVVFS